MRVIRKRNVMLRRRDAMGDLWVREQQTWDERREWFLVFRTHQDLKGEGWEKEGDCSYG
jgi:hypothetical protein